MISLKLLTIKLTTISQPNDVFHKFEASKKTWRKVDDPRRQAECPVRHPCLSSHPNDYHNYNKEIQRNLPLYHGYIHKPLFVK